ncbi:MAG: hypothetical protein R3E67_00155 [Pseudomonadales bacterium]
MRKFSRFFLVLCFMFSGAASIVQAALDDKDGDGLSDALEQAVGRNPERPDYILSTGYRRSCALDDSGVQCWGDEARMGVTPSFARPFALSVGNAHACVIGDNGVQCWGENSRGEATVPILAKPKAVSAGWYHSCAIDEKGVKCWGDNNRGQLDVPKKLKNVKQIAAGGFHTCALDEKGVSCWEGQLGAAVECACAVESTTNYSGQSSQLCAG